MNSLLQLGHLAYPHSPKVACLQPVHSSALEYVRLNRFPQYGQINILLIIQIEKINMKI